MVKAKQRLHPIDITYVAMFAALMAIGANLTSFITIGTVPLTLQTFFAILAGVLLGSRLGTLSMIVYTLIGLVGAPVFAGFSGGMQIITKSSFGFILSFIIMAYIAGKIIELKEQPNVVTFFFACFAGLATNYLIGTNYLYFSLKYVYNLEDVSLGGTWKLLLLFLYKDIVVTIFAAIISPRIYRAVQRGSKRASVQKKVA